jgi:hypothetical protein
VTSAPARVSLLAPDDWFRLPLVEDDALQRAVRTVVDRQFAGMDNQPLLRREAIDALLTRGRSARANGGIDMYLSYAPAGGMPLALSLVVSLLPLPPHVGSLHALAEELSTDGSNAVVVELPLGRAVRRQRVEPVDASEVGAPADQEAVLVDYTLLGPDGTMLLLSFSSPLVAVADALAELFEAVAGTVRWTA